MLFSLGFDKSADRISPSTSREPPVQACCIWASQELKAMAPGSRGCLGRWKFGNGTKESPRVPRRAEALGLRGTHSAAKEIPPKAQGQGYVRKNQVAAGADLGLRGCAPQGRPEAQCFKEVESVFST